MLTWLFLGTISKQTYRSFIHSFIHTLFIDLASFLLILRKFHSFFVFSVLRFIYTPYYVYLYISICKYIYIYYLCWFMMLWNLFLKHNLELKPAQLVIVPLYPEPQDLILLMVQTVKINLSLKLYLINKYNKHSVECRM